MSSAYGLSQVLRQGVTPGATNAQKRKALHVAVNEVVGKTFFGSMLKMARNSVFKGKYGHGGRGEEIFQGQLDQELVTRISQSSRVDFLDAMYERLAQRYPAEVRPGEYLCGESAKEAITRTSRIQTAYGDDQPKVKEIARG